MERNTKFNITMPTACLQISAEAVVPVMDIVHGKICEQWGINVF